jgi:8-oxo-dGTP diphosphatase
MVYDRDGNILVQDRKNKNWPGINFPGGHVEPDESFVSAAIREVREETGLLIESPKLCGVKQFKISKTGERFICLFFKTDKFSGELSSSEEGEVFWIPRKDLSKYPLVPDFESMLKVFEEDTLSEFYYYTEANGGWGLKLL